MKNHKVNKTVVILLSDKRSGSTMFQRELCKHPDVQTVAYSSHTYLETHHWLKGAVMLNLPAEKFSDGKVYPGYGGPANAKTYLLDTVKGNCPDFIPPQDDKELLFSSWEALCDKYANPVFFEKSPQVLANWGALELILEWMSATNYDVKIIGLVRNPLSVQYSAYQLFHTLPKKRQFGWMDIQANLIAIRQKLDESNYLELRYEDIIENPKPIFRSICTFIGIEPHSQVGSLAHDKSLLKWKTDPYFRFNLDPKVKELAKDFGYTDEELNNPEKPQAPFYKRIYFYCRSGLRRSYAFIWNRFINPIRLRLKNNNTIA